MTKMGAKESLHNEKKNVSFLPHSVHWFNSIMSFQMPSVECEGPPQPKNTSLLCGNGYQMDQKLTTATVLKIKQNSQCTRMKTKNYKAFFFLSIFPSIFSHTNWLLRWVIHESFWSNESFWFERLNLVRISFRNRIQNLYDFTKHGKKICNSLLHFLVGNAQNFQMG